MIVIFGAEKDNTLGSSTLGKKLYQMPRTILKNATLCSLFTWPTYENGCSSKIRAVKKNVLIVEK